MVLQRISKPPTPKVFGKPLQRLYHELLGLPKGPSQPQVLKSLSGALGARGLTYHPRTIKRQLLGNIRYIPEALEAALTDWLKTQKDPEYKKLLRQFNHYKQALEASQDHDLYVSPQFFIKMADAYLYLHKQLSRRQLAIRLSEDLKKKGIGIGLETLQAALAGKTLKIRKALEDELQHYFYLEGFTNKIKIEEFLKKVASQTNLEIQKIDIGNIAEMVDAYLLKTEGLSKRKLAVNLRDRLAAKGYRYHLSSIQSILEGKTHRTRKVILETLNEIFGSEGPNTTESLNEYLKSLNPNQLHWNHYVDAEPIPRLVQQLLEAHPQLTRRRLAMKLQEDLQDKHFKFSLNTLQYILAGKTKRTKQILFDLLQTYLKENALQDFAKNLERRHLSTRGRPSLEKKVFQAYEKFQEAKEEERASLYQEFLKIRSELIQRLWLKKQSKHNLSSEDNRQRQTYNEFADEEGPSIDPNEVSVALNLSDPLDRLVS
jgi:hypothetical protein